MGTFLRGIGGVLLSVATVAGLARNASAYDYFVPLIPNAARVQALIGSSDGCNICHTSGGGTPLNSFGANFKQANLDWYGEGTDPHTWSWSTDGSPLYGLFDNDPDGDGFTNGQELQDPDGFYLGGAAPGDPALVSVPGDASSTPPKVVASFSGNQKTRTLTAEAATNPADLPFTIAATPVTAPVEVAIDKPWLFLVPASATATGGTLRFNTSALPPSATPYVATISVSQPGLFNTDTLTVNLTIVVPSAGNLCGTIAQQCTAGACCRTDECRFWSSSHSCRDPEQCAAEVFCSGTSSVCALPTAAPANTVCRTAADSCQQDVTCNGTSLACPDQNNYKEAGDFCSQTQICDAEHACIAPPNVTPTKQQVKCLNRWNSSAGKAGQQLSKQANRCMSFGVKGELPDIMDECILPDSKTSASIASNEREARRSCAQDIPVGFGGTTSTDDLSSVTSIAISGAYHDVYGRDIDAAVPADSKEMNQCQSTVSKNLSKCIGARFDSYAKCVKKGLKSKTAPIQNFIGLQDCLNFENKAIQQSCALNSAGKPVGSMNKKCSDDSTELAAAFPGCAHNGPELERGDLYSCLDRVSRCNTCKSLKIWADLGIDCDDFDDHTPGNFSCK